MPRSLKLIAQSAMEPSPWDVGNDVLYRLCRRNPLHKDVETVVAKVWLIGRAYAAAIERGRDSSEQNDDFYIDVVGPNMVRSNIDQWIHAAAECRVSSPASLDVMADTHARLTRLFSQISGLQKRSLASKYLHFHVPGLFYIYDSRAVQAMRIYSRVVGRHSGGSEGLADKEYRAFCTKCRRLQCYLQEELDLRLTPRQIDNLLLRTHAVAT